MTVTFQTAGGGNLDIDFWLKDPRNVPLWSVDKRDTGTYSFTAQHDGRHTYCFSNEMSTVTPKTVSFNVHGVMYVEDDGAPSTSLLSCSYGRLIMVLARTGHTAPIETEIRNLANALEAVKDEQEYIVVRERIHRNSPFPRTACLFSCAEDAEAVCSRRIDQ